MVLFFLKKIDTIMRFLIFFKSGNTKGDSFWNPVWPCAQRQFYQEVSHIQLTTSGQFQQIKGKRKRAPFNIDIYCLLNCVSSLLSLSCSMLGNFFLYQSCYTFHLQLMLHYLRISPLHFNDITYKLYYLYFQNIIISSGAERVSCKHCFEKATKSF